MLQTSHFVPRKKERVLDEMSRRQVSLSLTHTHTDTHLLKGA